MNIVVDDGGDHAGAGPVRNKANRGNSSPYNRQRPPKGDINGTWEHDMFNGGNAKSSLSARLSDSASRQPPKINMGAAVRAMEEARGSKDITIKGASMRGNLIEVRGLVAGTTADDVEAIFRRCGHIVSSSVHTHAAIDGSVVVRLLFKEEKDALYAVRKFNGETADGRTLTVKSVGNQPVNLAARLDGTLPGDGSVDALLTPSGSSKLRSDDIIAQDSRATVLIAPPGADPKDYMPAQTWSRGRGRGRGRGGRGGRKGAGNDANQMDIDR